MPQRCASCGATNPDSAQWCGQCYRRFDAEPAPPSAQPGGDERATAPSRDGVTDSDASTPTGFRRRGETVEWACPSCEHFNAIELQHCEICGTAFVDRFRQPEPEVERDWGRALRLTMFAPGAGHVSVGRRGSGVSRLVLGFGWLLGALVLATTGGRRALVVAAPLLLGAVAVWLGSVVDIQRLQRGEAEILVGRRLLWLVVGVLGLLVLSLLASAATLAPS